MDGLSVAQDKVLQRRSAGQAQTLARLYQENVALKGRLAEATARIEELTDAVGAREHRIVALAARIRDLSSTVT